MRRQSLQPGRLEEMAYICEILRIHSRIAIHLDVRFRTSLGFLSLKLIDVHFVRSQMLGQCNRYSTRHAWRIANAKLKLVNDKRAKGYRSISSHGGDDVGALKRILAANEVRGLAWSENYEENLVVRSIPERSYRWDLEL